MFSHVAAQILSELVLLFMSIKMFFITIDGTLLQFLTAVKKIVSRWNIVIFSFFLLKT